MEANLEGENKIFSGGTYIITENTLKIQLESNKGAMSGVGVSDIQFIVKSPKELECIFPMH